MIAGWPAGKLSGMIIFVLACFGAILIPVTIYQTAQIYGAGFSLPIIGNVNIVTGLKPTIVTLTGERDKAKQELFDRTTQYNAATAKLKADGDQAVKDEQARTAIATAQLRAEQANNKALALRVKGILDHADPKNAHNLSADVMLYLDELRHRSEDSPTP